jgi:flagellin
MSFSIQTNVNSLAAQENLRVNGEFQSRTIGRLTSGYRINSSGDDSAGLAVANKYRADIAELQQGVRNANDGISTLQIIDGGLNNISKIMDRLKTLATQSASGTFTGNRSTLNTEYQALLTEINRQASNVGLVTGGTYNKNISVYIGGGSSQSNAKVTVDLSSAADRVDSGSLGIGSTAIAAGGSTFTNNTINSLNSGSATFLTGATARQNFTFFMSDNNTGLTVSVSVTGDADGISATDALAQLNNQLGAYGVTASASSNGYLVFGGTRAFAVTTPALLGGSGAIASVTDRTQNQSMYRYQLDTALTGATTTATFTTSSGTAVIDWTVARGSQEAAINDANAALNAKGIYVVTDSDGTGAWFMSSNTFSYSGGAGSFTSATGSATGPDSSASVTQGAEDAIIALSSAVTRLGQVQGKVGTAQNKLQYAINLANSQIGNFSGAESRIRDADVAAEAANLTKAQVLQQASLAAMAQANSAPQAVLALLRG